VDLSTGEVSVLAAKILHLKRQRADDTLNTTSV
jgi:hypothetical protein